MPKGIAVDNQGRLKGRTSLSDTNLLLAITVVVFFLRSEEHTSELQSQR